MTRADEIRAVLEDTTAPDEGDLGILRIVSDPQHRVDDLLEALRTNPELNQTVLKLSNSSVFELPTEIIDLSQTVAYLGARTLVRLAVAVCVYPFFARYGGPTSQAAEAWRHGIACGVAAQILAEIKCVADPNTAFTAGVLHDIGSLPLAPYVERDAAELFAGIEPSPRGFATSERQLFEIDHGTAGNMLAKEWQLPHDVRDAIQHHHEPEFSSQASELTQLVHVADSLVLQLGIGVGSEGLAYPACEDAVRRLHVQPVELDRVRLLLLDELSRTQDLLNLPERTGR